MIETTITAVMKQHILISELIEDNNRPASDLWEVEHSLIQDYPQTCTIYLSSNRQLHIRAQF